MPESPRRRTRHGSPLAKVAAAVSGVLLLTAAGDGQSPAPDGGAPQRLQRPPVEREQLNRPRKQRPKPPGEMPSDAGMPEPPPIDQR